jgi:hypothetical protein
MTECEAAVATLWALAVILWLGGVGGLVYAVVMARRGE